MNKDINDFLARGGVLAFPTDTVWGLGALPNELGANALFKIKKRPHEKHFTVMSNSLEKLAPYMNDFSKKAIELAQKFLPGQLTIIGNDDPVFGGIRIPKCKTFCDLCNEISGGCLATTSANLSGHPVLKTAQDIKETFPNVWIIDGKVPENAPPSTVIKVTGDKIAILRKGNIDVLQ